MCVLAASQGAEKRHLIIHLFAETRMRPGYVYVHEDEIPQYFVLDTAHSICTFVKGIIIEHLSSWRGLLDSDYSPAKPTLKIVQLVVTAVGMSRGWVGPSLCGTKVT